MFIDIHVHTRRIPGFPRANGKTYATPQQLIERYDPLGIERAVLLPGVSPEHAHVPQSIEEVIELSREYGGRFIPFCNVDPRMIKNTSDAPLGRMLEFYKEKGCKGVGELTANLPFDSPFVENLFHHCEQQEMPITFHVGPTIGGCYGLHDDPGFPRLEKELEKFSNLIFLGHSQPFWAEIAPLENPNARKGYPKGKVERPGRIVELMQRYPNLHGDLSAGSGHNAVSRDEEFGCWFLNHFQDRLYFGTDICAPDTPTPLVDYLLRLREEKKIGEDCFQKVARLNAIALLGLED